jgi:hypothetical protein
MKAPRIYAGLFYMPPVYNVIGYVFSQIYISINSIEKLLDDREPDVQMLLRICDVHNIPLATNPATARLIFKGLK